MLAALAIAYVVSGALSRPLVRFVDVSRRLADGDFDEATVDITVTAQNDTPVASADTDTVDEDGSVTTTVLGDDSGLGDGGLVGGALVRGSLVDLGLGRQGHAAEVGRAADRVRGDGRAYKWRRGRNRTQLYRI